ncbi:MAG: CPBP family intramembrane metalloprotease [Butyrivibrio sp.]|nr:CPBP family intramembrane metalloprotease [Butyrivibrio sp.]
MENTFKKRLTTFIAVAYGVTFFMYLIMFFGLRAGKDLSVFPNAQMMYPACGVMLGFLLFGDKEKKIPKAGFIVALITGVVAMIMAIVSLIAPITMIDTGAGQTTNWNVYSIYAAMVGSFIAYILFWACGKEKRKNVGLSRNNIPMSIIMVLVFLVLFVLRMLISSFVSQFVTPDEAGGVQMILNVLVTPATYISALSLLINFPLTFLMYWGEEYGWRYYLQPILQKKFGLRLGVVILGVVWGLWHIGLDFMYYTTTTGPAYLLSQIITCIGLAIFFGYAYMKTQNIWAIALMHFMNNNFLVLFTGNDVNVLQNQTVTLSYIPIHIISFLIFIIFIFAPVYGRKKTEQSAL